MILGYEKKNPSTKHFILVLVNKTVKTEGGLNCVLNFFCKYRLKMCNQTIGLYWPEGMTMIFKN